VGKLPHVTVLFWVMKILATTLGETGGDLFAQTLNLGYLASSGIFVVLFGISLVAQLKADRFRPALFWAVIVATSTLGTTVSDFMNRTAGLGYLGGASALGGCLLVALLIWKLSGETMNVERIRTARAEVFYWIATLVSNTLGTSSGDLLAHDTGLGFVASTAVITVLLLLIVGAHYWTSISGTILFWAAYVLTRPFGANFGNTLSKASDEGGVGLGTGGASAILGGLLLLLVVYQIRTHRSDLPDPWPAGTHQVDDRALQQPEGHA
jgi:uncharacterized membrane-anchored protein